MTTTYQFESHDKMMGFLEGIKNDSNELIGPRNEVILSLDGKKLFMEVNGKKTEMTYMAAKQFFHRVHKYANPTYNLAYRMDDNKNGALGEGVSLINKAIASSNSAVLKHYVVRNPDYINATVNGIKPLPSKNNLILGTVSKNHSRVHDFDVMGEVMKYSAGFVEDWSDRFMGFWNENTTSMAFTLNKFKDPVGEEWDTRLRIENNEFGRHCLKIIPEVVRVVCSNGATITQVATCVEFMHTKNFNLERFKGAFANMAEKLEVALDVIEASIQREWKVSSDPETIKKFWEDVRKEFHITKTDIDIVKVKLEKEPEDLRYTSYGIGNAISDTANDYIQKDTERYLRYQEIAGTIYSAAYAEAIA